MMGGEKFNTIKVLIRDPDAMGGGVVAMVEENEIRATLSPFERKTGDVILADSVRKGSLPSCVADLSDD